ncbi:hypothetical protein MTO96_030198 [Rhipicephalus appendiculatus]
MRRNRAGARTPPTEAATLTSCTPGAISTLSGGGSSKNIGALRYSPHMAPDEYVVVIKPRENCNLKQYRGTGSIGNAIRAAISQHSGNAEAAPNLAHQYSLHPLWEQNLVVVGTKEECVLHILLSLKQLRLTDKTTINVQAYLKATDNMGKGVIRLANTFTTDYILENTTSPNNLIIGARRLGSTNVVTLTFEHSNIPRLVFFLNEATLVQQYRKTNAVCAMCGKAGHRTDVCPAPVPETERCALCGKTGLDASQPHECHPSCALCGGSHATGCRECPRRYHQPAPAKPPGQQAGQTRDCSRTPSGDRQGQEESINAAGNDTPKSTSRSRSKKRAPSRSKSRSQSRSRSRSRGAQPVQRPNERSQTSAAPAPALKLTGPQVSWASKVASQGPQNSSQNTESPLIEQLLGTIEKQNRMLTELKQLVAQQRQGNSLSSTGHYTENSVSPDVLCSFRRLRDVPPIFQDARNGHWFYPTQQFDLA